MEELHEIINTVRNHFTDGVTKIQLYNDESEIFIYKEPHSVCGINYSLRIVCDSEGSLITDRVEDFAGRIGEILTYGQIKIKTWKD